MNENNNKDNILKGKLNIKLQVIIKEIKKRNKITMPLPFKLFKTFKIFKTLKILKIFKFKKPNSQLSLFN